MNQGPSGGAPPADPDELGHCARCAALVKVERPEPRTTNTGKAYLVGRCAQCGAEVTLIPAAPPAPPG